MEAKRLLFHAIVDHKKDKFDNSVQAYLLWVCQE
jgi:hypothetical protein